MSPEQFAAVLIAAGGVLTALALVLAQVVALRRAVNGRMAELLEATRAAAHKQGELQGRDFVRFGQPKPPIEKESS